MKRKVIHVDFRKEREKADLERALRLYRAKQKRQLVMFVLACIFFFSSLIITPVIIMLVSP